MTLSFLSMCAGNQFSFPLIDFVLSADIRVRGWESVLLPPDRLRAAAREA